MTSGPGLVLYNSMGRRLEEFVPSGPVVGLYSCGPTVYSYPHLGNMRAFLAADTLRRVLRWDGYEVRHVMNVTDVGHPVADTELGQDKLEAAAERERRSVADLARHYTEAFFDDLRALNVVPASEYPRASHYVPQMIEFARVLEERGYTYRLPSGLYFDSTRSKGYGALALLDTEGQLEGARVEHVEGRRTKTDFVLWRSEEPGRPRVMRWDSPWGWGSPGWHLECSVMGMALLGDHFDVHSGGVDHRQLHHVNEIAQSEAYLEDGLPWVRYWVHNEFLQIRSSKMAKSAGEAPRLADLAEQGIHPLAFRLFVVTASYRTPVDFTVEAVTAAQATLRRLVERVSALGPLPEVQTAEQARSAVAGDDAAAAAVRRIGEAADGDLSTPQVLAVLQESLRDTSMSDAGKRGVAAAADAVLGLRLGDPALRDELDAGRDARELTGDERAEIERLVAERREARSRRDWVAADELRDRLTEVGVTLVDTPSGTEWSLR